MKFFNVALALALALMVAGCSKKTAEANAAPQPESIVQPGAPGQDSKVVSAVPKFKDDAFTPEDVEFMQGMIHHHHQALEMVALIPTHTDTVQLLELGKKIELSQTGEITWMTKWLQARGQEAPMIMPDGNMMMGKMNMGLMPGMLTQEQMKALAAAHGGEFDHLFLTGMIQHHSGALKMVADLRAAGGGLEPDTDSFITGVDTDQRIEITRMNGLLGRPTTQ